MGGVSVDSGGKGRKVAAAMLAVVVLASGGFYLIRNSAFVQSEPTLQRISAN